MKAYIYLSSGAVVETDVEDITTRERGGQCSGLSWVRSEEGKRLLHVNPDHVIAVTVQK